MHSLWEFLAAAGYLILVISLAVRFSDDKKQVFIIENIKYGFGESRWWK